MNPTLKTLFTTAAILSTSHVFASDAEFLGGGAQPERGMTTEACRFNALKKNQSLCELDRKIDKDKDQARTICNEIAAHLESTPDQRIQAARDLSFFGWLDDSARIAREILKMPGITIDHKLQVSELLFRHNKDDSIAIWTEIAASSESTFDQKLIVASFFKQMYTDKLDKAAEAIWTEIAGSSKSTFDQKYSAAWGLKSLDRPVFSVDIRAEAEKKVRGSNPIVGWVLNPSHRTEKAITIFKEIVADSDCTVAEKLKVAKDLCDINQYPEAEAILIAIAKSSESTFEQKCDMAELLRRYRSDDAAAAIYIAIAEDNATPTDFQLKCAEELRFLEGYAEKAVEICNAVLKNASSKKYKEIAEQMLSEIERTNKPKLID